MNKQVLVSVDKVGRRYGDLSAVHEVSFYLNRGEVLGFLGANGAGKSTTMNMLCGVLAPTQGTIKIAGHDIIKEPIKAKSRLGYLPEQPPLYRDLSVDEYLDYCARLRRVPAAKRRQRISEIKQRCGLGKVGRRIIGQLSKGYQQRVGIAQAIVHLPDVIVLDEPTVGLDPVQIREIRSLIRELAQDHGIILSTHILPEVQAICDRVQILDHGRIVFADDIAALSAYMASTTLLLAVRKEPNLDALLAIEGVVAVQCVGAGCFQLEIDEKNNPAERVAQYAVENQLGLYQLTPQQTDLEQVFVDITTNDNALPPERTLSEGASL
ncbi:MAG: ATP-binding cassette domain-containing protein [Gammaproteobacteria bacterium]|nr:ATP-binding cassette domain-containing protein [Gammaproteobacteria bacterium]